MKSIYFATVVTFCSLYAAQPIQPLFQEQFQLSSLQALLFTTLMMAPLSVAPLLYGFILEAASARAMVRWALGLLGVLELIFSLVNNYLALLTIRGAQGLIIPAILTSIVSYISYTSEKEQVQQNVAYYIGATILGGFLGRFLSGIFTDLFGWRFFFFVLGLLLLCNSYLLKSMVHDAKMNYARPKLREIALILRKRSFFFLYGCIFCLFFVFAAMMNFLPFELKKLVPGAGQSGVGFLYIGYSMGLLVSINAKRIVSRLGNVVNAVTTGIVIFGTGCLFFLVENYLVMFGSMFVFCVGLFIAHSLLSGLLNRMATENKAIANGLYISFYYTGGTLGSILPGLLFAEYGWRGFVMFLFCMIAVAMLLLRLMAGEAVKSGSRLF
ncbi:MFS transporter [Desulforhopalus singaporensis]|uniref:MFS transporter, YNFM family, putative membrane transport protein n=1 Tax=Desulforhopalus singaporensis TaxID=91360 RepID=A0A1H0UHF6_9BACT|nr:MFS transporter [Desulforhopalus singaporensis]SDP65428.1 MFS transporter, YNFM family, putative membrane transport protein [Desulforhopalus singaporensis]